MIFLHAAQFSSLLNLISFIFFKYIVTPDIVLPLYSKKGNVVILTTKEVIKNWVDGAVEVAHKVRRQEGHMNSNTVT